MSPILASIAMLLDDPLPDSIPLTAQEKVRFTELEAVVERNLETFLSVGRALAEIRNKRLYRQQFGTFEDYCVKRWGFSGSRGLDLVRSASVAEVLLAGPAAPQTGDAPLPLDLSADVLRPLQRLEPELANSCWRLACRVGKPTSCTVGRIVRAVEQAVSQGTNGTGAPKPKVPQSQKKIFLLSVHRLADSPWFSAHLVVQGVDETRARKHLEAAQQLISRLHELIGELRREFPEL
jgi:hypothetical protein